MGKIRITNELKFRKINARLISTKSLPKNTEETFQNLADRWKTAQRDALKRRKKFCDNLLRKGFESNLVYEKLRNWNQWNANDVTVVHQNGFFLQNHLNLRPKITEVFTFL
jgi:SOS response regulatory protein OraA/RecX